MPRPRVMRRVHKEKAGKGERRAAESEEEEEEGIPSDGETAASEYTEYTEAEGGEGGEEARTGATEARSAAETEEVVAFLHDKVRRAFCGGRRRRGRGGRHARD